MRRREHLTPDLTPLIDIVFLLLIFFLVASVFKKEELALLLELPKSKIEQEITKDRVLTVELSREEIALNGKKMSFELFEAQVKDMKNSKKPIIVRIDKEVRYERVAKLLDVLQSNKLFNISLVNEKK